jgi:hypothetical protein
MFGHPLIAKTLPIFWSTTFKVDREKVEAFYTHLRQMNFYDDNTQTTGEMFEEFFPGRSDVHRLLMEPISYANGSHINDPAITYGIVFSNFMSKGVFTFQGGTDTLIKKMVAELKNNGCEVRKCALVEGVDVEDGKVVGIRVRSQNTGEEGFPVRTVKCKAVLSNANVRNTIEYLVGEDKFSDDFVAEAKAVRNNTSSCQVYMGIKKGETIPNIGDLVFTSKASEYSIGELTSIKTSSHTFSVYYPETRPHLSQERYTVVASLNAQWDEWNELSEEDYQARKPACVRSALVAWRLLYLACVRRLTTSKRPLRAPSTTTPSPCRALLLAPSLKASKFRWSSPNRSKASTTLAPSGSLCLAGWAR